MLLSTEPHLESYAKIPRHFHQSGHFLYYDELSEKSLLRFVFNKFSEHFEAKLRSDKERLRRVCYIHRSSNKLAFDVSSQNLKKKISKSTKVLRKLRVRHAETDYSKDFTPLEKINSMRIELKTFPESFREYLSEYFGRKLILKLPKLKSLGFDLTFNMNKYIELLSHKERVQIIFNQVPKLLGVEILTIRTTFSSEVFDNLYLSHVLEDFEEILKNFSKLLQSPTSHNNLRCLRLYFQANGDNSSDLIAELKRVQTNLFAFTNKIELLKLNLPTRVKFRINKEFLDQSDMMLMKQKLEEEKWDNTPEVKDVKSSARRNLCELAFRLSRTVSSF